MSRVWSSPNAERRTPNCGNGQDMKPWLGITAAALATGVLALGGSAALWGRPAFLLDPWQRLFAPSGASLDAVKDLQDQVARLNVENILLRRRLDQYSSIANEGGFPPERVVVARGRVVGRTARSGRRFLELDVGAGHGVTRDLPVTAGWSLAGLVTGVREARCLVQDLSDSEARIAAAVLDGRSVIAEGVLAGSGSPTRARLLFIEPRDGLRIDPGALVVTAGSDGKLPAGLLLGRIASAARGSGAEHWDLQVQLSADASTAESLLVLRVPEAPAAPAGTAAP